jgi:type IV pilus assembly protein PilY1
MFTRLHKSVAALVAFVAGIAMSSVAAAQTCEVPLVIQRSAGQASVLIILDTSGSMNEPVYHSAYNPATSYSGRFDRDQDYDIVTDGTYSQRNFDSAWPSTPTAYLVDSDQGEDGRYPGNYMNWIFSHATSTQRAALPTVTRIQVAKASLVNILNAPSSVNYGLMRLNGDDGGTLVSPIGTSRASIISSVNSMRADSWTPLAETLVDALDYFKTTGASAPITVSCQKSFIILATDGHPTQDLNVPSYLRDYDGDGLDPGNCASIGAPNPNSDDCSHYMDDVATYMFANDMRTDIDGFQNVTTFVIGFAINAPLLQLTATKGGGSFFNANSPTQLIDALNRTLSIIETRISAGSSVSVVASEGQSNNRLYRARYESVSWRGYVEAFDLPYTPGDQPAWKAGDLLLARTPASREIFTSTTGTNKINFVSTNAGTLQTPLGAASVTAATNVINYTRGTDLAGFRDRDDWKLGDIVDSSPVAVGKPSQGYDFLSYGSFRAANYNRTEVIYVGANDGMLHCFNAADGVEKWGYIPKNQLPRLNLLMSNAYCHNYFVNMAPAVYDIHNGSTWKSVLIGGQERGGSGLFALDVTDPNPNNVTVMWDKDFPTLMGSWNRPELVRDKNRNAFVLVAGTGMDSTTGQGRLLVIDPSNGTLLTTFNLGSPVTRNLITGAKAIDKDFDGFDDLLYVGDYSGKLWRVNLKTNPWTVTQLFENNQPIQGTPALSVDESGKVLIYFGTGAYLRPADLTNTTTQSFYAIFDNHSGTLIRRTDLVNQTSAINAVTATSKGWFLDLVQYSGERVIRSPALVAGTVYFTSFRPRANVCESGGESWLYSLDFEDGSAPDHANKTENNNLADRVERKGDGILSNPTVDLLNEDIIFQSSDTSLITHNINIALQKVVVRSWRQRWN